MALGRGRTGVIGGRGAPGAVEGGCHSHAQLPPRPWCPHLQKGVLPTGPTFLSEWCEGDCSFKGTWAVLGSPLSAGADGGGWMRRAGVPWHPGREGSQWGEFQGCGAPGARPGPEPPHRPPHPPIHTEAVPTASSVLTDTHQPVAWPTSSPVSSSERKTVGKTVPVFSGAADAGGPLVSTSGTSCSVRPRLLRWRICPRCTH